MDIPIDGSKYVCRSFNPPSLRISNLHKTDTGKYRCGASNFVGTTYSCEVDVNVIGGKNAYVVQIML